MSQDLQGLSRCNGWGGEVGVEVGRGRAQGSGGVADLLSRVVEHGYAYAWEEVVVAVPVGFGASGEDRKVVREGGACSDTSVRVFRSSS